MKLNGRNIVFDDVKHGCYTVDSNPDPYRFRVKHGLPEKLIRFIKDVVFVLTGNTLRPRNKCFKGGFGQWDGVVLIEKKTNFVSWVKGYPAKLKRRITSVKERKYLLEQYYTKELGMKLRTLL